MTLGFPLSTIVPASGLENPRGFNAFLLISYALTVRFTRVHRRRMNDHSGLLLIHILDFPFQFGVPVNTFLTFNALKVF